MESVTLLEAERMLLRPEVAEDFVGDTVGELMAVSAVGEQAAERADDRIDRLTTEHGRPSSSTTLRPARAAVSAAEVPAIPAPTTQISASTRRGAALPGA